MATKKTKAVGGTTRRRVAAQAIDYSYNDHRMYVSVIHVRKLFPYCRVSRAHEDSAKGYQRHLEPKRWRSISAYLNGGHVVPGSLILSAQPEAAVRFVSGELSFAAVEGAFLVIDGQHRLKGAAEAKNDVPAAVCIFSGLSPEQEVQYFLDVNGNQKGVPRTLQLEITKFLVEEGSPDQVRIKLFKELNERPDSPLAGLMSPTKSVVGKLSHVPFKTALDPILARPPLSNAVFEGKVKLLINFLCAAQRILTDRFSSGDKLSNAAFFQAVFGAFSTVASLTYSRFENYKEDSFYEVLKPLVNIDWDRHTGTNKKSIAAFTNVLVAAVSNDVSVSDEML